VRLSKRKINRNTPLASEELKGLHQLKVNGALTQQEYNKLKDELLGNS
jgi:hypothetical protein